MTPTDTLFGSQWHFSLLGKRGSELLITRIWNEYDGTGIHIAIYDDGVELTHTDLNDNYDATRHVVINGITLSGNVTSVNDTHGTSVAGLIAAENNGQNTVGVAFGADITGINIFDPNSSIYVNSTNSTILNNFYNAVLQGANFDVINHSWGTEPVFDSDQNLNTPGSSAARLVSAYGTVASTGRGGLGTVIVQAAGNENLDANGDGVNASRYTITVGALHNDGFAASYSNFGPSLLVSAAGSDDSTVRNGLGTVTTDRTGTAGYNLRNNLTGNYDYTDDFGGTSAATPIVSAVAALMLDANPNLGWRDVQHILAISANHTGSAIGTTTPLNGETGNWFINDATNWNGGGLHFSNDYGFGSVNAYAAVRMAEVWSIVSPAQTSANEQSLTPTTFNFNTPITDLATTTVTFNIAGNLTLEHVDLTLKITHNFLSDLRIYLVSPTGTEVKIYDDLTGQDFGTPLPVTWTFGIEALRGELAAGTWTLRIVDDVAQDGGTLNTVNFTAFGTTPGADDVYTYTDEFNTLRSLEPTRQTLTDSDGGNDWINAAAITGNAIIDLRTAATSTLDAAALITLAAGTVIENAITGDGLDILTGNSSANKLYGMRGNDQLEGLGGADTIDGGAGSDSAYYFNSAAGVTVNLNAHTASGGDAQGDILLNIENLTGSALADTLTGDAQVNTLQGGLGADILNGGLGSDFLFGGAGDDRIYYDALDLAANVNGGADRDTLVVVDGNLPVGFNLAASAFELAEWNRTDTAGQAWNTIQSLHDANWNLLSSTTVNDNGTSSINVYDVPDQYIWSSVRYDYNAASVLTLQVLVLNDQTRIYEEYDITNTQVWSSLRTDYNAALQWTQQVLALDSGTTVYEQFDPADTQVWSSLRTDYSATSEWLQQVVVFDDGLRVYDLFDPADLEAWSSYRNVYTSTLQLQESKLVDDSGTYTTVDYDVANTQTWNEWHRSYSAANVLLSEYFV
jgi:subtilisin-like proprotein convertase family protein